LAERLLGCCPFCDPAGLFGANSGQDAKATTIAFQSRHNLCEVEDFPLWRLSGAAMQESIIRSMTGSCAKKVVNSS
jgi:hypothetical protein